MRMNLPEHVKTIIHTLQAQGFEAYAVGGCVRDTILGRQPQDWDITTSALPEQVKGLFHRTIDTGIQHGTVTVMMDKTGYEVTTYRIDGEYEDARHPKEVTFTSNLVEDLKRRDFTINAMAYNDEQGLVDAFDGLEDLEKGIIRCVGNPLDRFGEDALRMLRAVRFAAQLGFEIESATRNAVKELAPTIGKVSAERIQVELVKLLLSDHPEEMGTVYELGLTKVFLPEFDLMMETPQKNKHHCYSVGEHTLHTLMNIRSDKVLRLSMLFHDVAKPKCRTVDDSGQDHYYGHPQEGADLTRDILKRLKFDNDTVEQCCTFVRYHDERPEITEKNVRRSMNRMGVDAFPRIFEIKRADTLGQSIYRRQEKLAYLEEYENVYRLVCEKQQCVQKKDLAIGGKELIALGMKPGKELGEILEDLFQQVLENPELNQKEKLIELAHKKISSFI